MQRKRIGEILIEQGVITEAQLLKALEKQEVEKKKLGIILLEMGLIERDALIQALALQAQHIIQLTKDTLEEVDQDTDSISS